MLTETGNSVYVDHSQGYGQLEEILHSTDPFDRRWPGRRSGLISSEPVQHKRFSQIISQLKDIRPTAHYPQISSKLNLLSILNPPASGQAPAHLPWRLDGVERDANFHLAQRRLISGMSHLVNDLLMGIQGNLSLIRLSLDPDHPCRPVLSNAEELIHSGSFMIHLLLGYLSERRFKARQMRFHQLISEISGSSARAEGEWARRRFEHWIGATSKFEALAHIAENCSRIFKRLILNLRECLDGMGSEARSSVVASARLEKIDELSDTITLMAEKLLRFAGSRAPELKTLSIADLLHERLDLFRQRHGHILLKKQVSRSIPAIQADAMLLTDAFDQILRNAAESMPSGGCLMARAKQLTFSHACNKHSGTDTVSYVMVEIADTGIGINKDAQNQIFDPFFTTKPHGKGLGLGLSTAMGTFRGHGGFIDFESKAGKGSRFKLYLP